MSITRKRIDPTTLPNIVAKAVKMAVMGMVDQPAPSEPVIRRYKIAGWESEFTGGAASRIVLKFKGNDVLKVRLSPGWQKNAACLYTEEIAAIPQGWRGEFAALDLRQPSDC